MLQPSNKQNYSDPGIQAIDTVIKAVDTFCYVSSLVLTSKANVDKDVNTIPFSSSMKRLASDSD